MAGSNVNDRDIIISLFQRSQVETMCSAVMFDTAQTESGTGKCHFKKNVNSFLERGIMGRDIFSCPPPN